MFLNDTTAALIMLIIIGIFILALIVMIAQAFINVYKLACYESEFEPMAKKKAKNKREERQAFLFDELCTRGGRAKERHKDISTAPLAE